MGIVKRILDPRNSPGYRATSSAASMASQMRQNLKTMRSVTDDRFSDVQLTADAIVTPKGDGGPIAGAVARLETTGEIRTRITATRMAIAGPFAFAMKKSKDTRRLYLTIEGVGWSLVRAVPASITNQQRAREFVAAVNVASTAANASLPTSQPPTAEPSPLDQIARLAELRDSGVLTAEEFDAKKAELLGRM